MDKVSKMQLLSMKRAVFVDKAIKMQHLSMKRGVFVDKAGEGERLGIGLMLCGATK